METARVRDRKVQINTVGEFCPWTATVVKEGYMIEYNDDRITYDSVSVHAKRHYDLAGIAACWSSRMDKELRNALRDSPAAKGAGPHIQSSVGRLSS